MITPDGSCPFGWEIAESPLLGDVVVLPDAHPMSEGHLLSVPRRHTERIEELNEREWDALFAEVRRVARQTRGTDGVAGVNTGVNSGVAAGQTIPHAHVHVIPRGHGDSDDPRGGVRWVITARAPYWESARSARPSPHR